MSSKRQPPEAYRDFVARFPELAEAWDRARDGERAGPLDAKGRRLVKLGVAVGALRRGAVRSAARKALGAGASADEIRQVVALAATTLGFPAAVAAHSWLEDVLDE